jgi:hypothetical protein
MVTAKTTISPDFVWLASSAKEHGPGKSRFGGNEDGR